MRSEDVDGDTCTVAARSRFERRASRWSSRTRAWSTSSRSLIRAARRTSCGARPRHAPRAARSTEKTPIHRSSCGFYADHETQPLRCRAMAAQTEPAPAPATTPTARTVVVIDRDLPKGLAANAAAVLAHGFGARLPDLVGPD